MLMSWEEISTGACAKPETMPRRLTSPDRSSCLGQSQSGTSVSHFCSRGNERTQGDKIHLSRRGRQADDSSQQHQQQSSLRVSAVVAILLRAQALTTRRRLNPPPNRHLTCYSIETRRRLCAFSLPYSHDTLPPTHSSI